MRLKNKICLITGAASGMGRAACDIFYQEGAKIIAMDVREPEKKFHDGIFFIKADVGNSQEVSHAINEGVQHFGGLDVLYNNAGIFLETDRSVVETEPGTWEKTLDVNAKGIYLVCKYGIPHLIKRGSGSIINIASFVALVGCSVPQDAYTASKGAVLALTKSLAVQFGPKGIRANAICPGPIETPLLTQWLLKKPAEKAKRLNRIPMGRFGQTKDIVYAALYLASDESSWTNGASLVVDGGITSNYF
ncbi:MAG: SDR family oxidoreductase [Elusimicrobia bacterium]|nr:SDR family oxidoreductase [Elusimicrobiota bacterium]